MLNQLLNIFISKAIIQINKIKKKHWIKHVVFIDRHK